MFLLFKNFSAALLFIFMFSGCSGKLKQTDASVEITSFLGDNQTFMAGDSMQFLISLSTSSYLHLFYENANGQVVQLIPSVVQANSFYSAGDFIIFPPEDGDIQLKVSPPFGSEHLWLAACDRHIELSASADVNHLDAFALSLSALSHVFKEKVKNTSSKCAFDELRFSTASP